MNITDVGHNVGDGDSGEDKMSVASKRENKSSYEIAKYYTDCFFADCCKLNVRKPDVVSNATDNIDMYIKMITKLLEDEYAYIADGNVYFDTTKFKNYYELSGRNSDDLMVAVREDIEEDTAKRNPFDFGLWFTNSKFDNQEFTGTNLSAIFGGVECDLRNSLIKSDCVINANSIFGGIDIFVPSYVKVKVKSTPIFGGISNKAQQNVVDDSPTVYVNGLCIFGGIEIK
mgnify:CR=1 FL=1